MDINMGLDKAQREAMAEAVGKLLAATSALSYQTHP
jgi:DNA-binding ferritin-like protein